MNMPHNPSGDPYGQQPPPGPYPGQGGFGTQPGPQPGHPQGPPPGYPQGYPPAQQPFAAPQPPAPRRPNKTVRIIGLVVAAVVATVVVLWVRSNSVSSAEAGDCIAVLDSADADIEKVDCAAEEAIYEVGVVKDDSSASCPADTYIEYTQTGRSELLLCLVLNATDGDCFSEGMRSHERVACTDPNATFQVVKVIDGKNDAAECGDGAPEALAYPEPARTLCRAVPDVTAS